MNIFRFEFKRNLKSCLIWSAICSALIILFMSMFPSMKSSGMQDIIFSKIDALPSGMLEAFNISMINFSNLNDYLGYAIQYIFMAGAVYAALLGVSSLIKEETDGTIEFLYSKPVKRSSILFSKLLAIALIYCLFVVIVGIFTICISIIVKPEDISVLNMIMDIKIIFIGMIILGYVFMAIGLLLSVIIKSSKQGTSLSIGVFFITYFLGITGKIKEEVKVLKLLSPFDYFLPSKLLKDGLNITYTIVSVIVIIVLIFLSNFIYKRKDMKI